ncbi:MAG: hypothetical protein WAJ87_22535 [Bryobacteraceae bacterium]
MRNRRQAGWLFVALAIFLAGAFPSGLCFGQSPDTGGQAGTSAPPPAPPPPPAPKSSEGLPRFGVAAGVSTLGAGIQAATAVTRHSNVRFGFNDFSYSTTFNKDGIAYNGTLSLRSAEVLYDQYVAGGFHISPGIMIYDGNKGTAGASVAGGQSFTLGGSTFYSDASDPVSGTGTIGARKVAPEILIGFGNLLPRSSRHFTVNFEAGLAYQGSPSAALHLTGSTCLLSPGQSCQSIATNPTIQTNIMSEQNTINSSLSVFKYYPIIRLTFGFKR